MRMRQSMGRKEASPWKRSRVKRKVSSVNACSPRPKTVSLSGRVALTPLPTGRRLKSKKVSEEPVKLKKTCCPKTAGQMGWSPFRELRLKGSKNRERVYMYSPGLG